MTKRTLTTVILALVLIHLNPIPVSAAVTLTSGGTPTVTGTLVGTAASTDTAVGSTITATLNFGDVSLRNTNARVKIVMPIRISTTSNYSVRVQASVIPGASGVQAADIGFGVG